MATFQYDQYIMKTKNLEPTSSYLSLAILSSYKGNFFCYPLINTLLQQKKKKERRYDIILQCKGNTFALFIVFPYTATKKKKKKNSIV